MTITAESAERLGAAFGAHRAAALALARRMLGDTSLAEDAVQLACVQIGVRLGHDPVLLDADPRGAVLRATRWSALKLLERDRQRHAAVPLAEDGTPGQGSDAAWHSAEARLLCAEILTAVPAHYRDVLSLRFFEDQPDAVAAARLRLTLKAYRCRLDRALARARLCAEGLGMSTPAAGVLVAAAAGRLRRRFAAWRLRLSHRLSRLEPSGRWIAELQQLGHLAATLGILAALPSGGAAGSGVVGLGGAAAVASHGVSPATAGTAGTRPAGAAFSSSRAVSLAEAAPSPPPNPPPPPMPLLPSSAASETPDDVAIWGVAPAPHYEQNHVIVATGEGADCRCPVVLRSLDGGATWTTKSSPAAFYTVYLPPDYPKDPRILLADGQDYACLFPAFGSLLCTPLPVVQPLAFDAAFDQGFPVVYSTEPNVGVVAFDVSSGLTHPLLAGDRYLGSPLAAPTAVTATAVYVEAGRSTTSLTPAAAGGSGHTDLYACHRDFTCTAEAEDQTWPAGSGLSVDRSDPSGELVTATPDDNWQRRLVSSDGGRSFTAVQGEAGLEFQDFQLIGAAPHVILWSVMSTPPTATANPQASLWHRSLAGGGWQPASMPPSGPSYFRLFAITPQRLIAISSAFGYWCSDDGGATWAARCPAA